MQHRNAPLTPNGHRRLVALVEEAHQALLAADQWEGGAPAADDGSRVGPAASATAQVPTVAPPWHTGSATTTSAEDTQLSATARR
jgi:hypothetical protein